ncbi:MAG: hypothetical protein AAGB25_03220 [Pseudomonadota bacterium]
MAKEVRIVSDRELASRERGLGQIIYSLPLLGLGVYAGFVAAETLGHPVFGIIAGLAVAIGLIWLVWSVKIVKWIYSAVMVFGFAFFGFGIVYTQTGQDPIWGGLGAVFGLMIGGLFYVMGEA